MKMKHPGQRKDQDIGKTGTPEHDKYKFDLPEEIILHFLQKATDLSREGMMAKEGGPFGCVILKDGKIVGKGYNKVLADNDPTAHAEIIAIREACHNLDTFELSGCKLFTSCEPCPMCMAAIYWAHIKTVYYANSKEDAKAIGFDDSFIYEQLTLPPLKRAINIQQVEVKEARQVFEEWNNMEGKTQY